MFANALCLYCLQSSVRDQEHVDEPARLAARVGDRHHRPGRECAVLPATDRGGPAQEDPRDHVGVSFRRRPAMFHYLVCYYDYY